MASQQTRQRNWATYVLFALAVIAGILAFIDAGRYMGWLGFTATIPGFGEISFVLPNAQWFAAIMSALLGVIWFVVAWWLWNLNPSGLLFMQVIAVVNLIFLGLAILGRTSFSDVMWAVIVNVLVLILSLLDSTKQAFTPTMADVQAAAAEARTDAQARAAEIRAENAEEIAAAKADAQERAAKAQAAAAAAEAAPAAQDLTVVEGVGPKTAEALQAAGVMTLADLAMKSPDEISQILKDASLSADPQTWPEQAQLAAAGKMDELKDYQDKLQGGREV